MGGVERGGKGGCVRGVGVKRVGVERGRGEKGGGERVGVERMRLRPTLHDILRELQSLDQIREYNIKGLHRVNKRSMQQHTLHDILGGIAIFRIHLFLVRQLVGLLAFAT